MTRSLLLGAVLSVGLCAPALAAPTFERVTVETNAFNGDQPAGYPLWQKVIVSWEGDVTVEHFSPFHSERFTGVATRDELDALARAVTRARLGKGMPATFSAAPWDDSYAVESSSSVRRGQTKGSTDHAGSYGARLRPLRAAILALAERLVHPPALPDGQERGRVEVRGYTTYLNLGGNRRYEIRPRETADALAALDGEWVVVEGELSGSSDWSRKVEVTALLEPRRATVRGRLLADPARLEVDGREVPLTASEDVAKVLGQVSGEVELQGFVREGPRGPRGIAVEGVRARVASESYPFVAGDEVLLTDAMSFGHYLTAVRLSDGRSRQLRRDLIDTTPASSHTAGMASALGGL